jgi:tRNA G18 (ribose-2'-O)-methylase SpoU
LNGARGYFGVAAHRPKTAANVGTLWRSATVYGAAFLATVGHRYVRQPSDTPKSPLHTPLHHYADLDDLIEHLPWSCPLIGVELIDGAIPLGSFTHPMRALYLLGAEDNGLPPAVQRRCHHVVQIPSEQSQSLNVAVAGSIVLYDRHVKLSRRTA